MVGELRTILFSWIAEIASYTRARVREGGGKATTTGRGESPQGSFFEIEDAIVGD